MFYLTEEDWMIIEDSFNADQLKYYHNIYSIMHYLSEKLKYSNQTVLSTAMIYFHKYSLSLVEKRINGIEKVYTCATCLFLSTKVTNRLVAIKDIIAIIRNFVSNKTKMKIIAESDEEIKSRLCTLEYDLLVSIGFDTNIDSPYKILPKIRKCLEEHTQLNSKKIIELCCFYINDTFTLPVCLYFIPDVIAIACMNILAQNFKIQLDKDIICDLSDMAISKEELAHCERVISLIFEANDDKQRRKDKEKEADIVVSNASATITSGSESGKNNALPIHC